MEVRIGEEPYVWTESLLQPATQAFWHVVKKKSEVFSVSFLNSIFRVGISGVAVRTELSGEFSG